ncbi:hypothetical protein HispidOSU_024972 [Sigmodon hispidus]
MNDTWLTSFKENCHQVPDAGSHQLNSQVIKFVAAGEPERVYSDYRRNSSLASCTNSTRVRAPGLTDICEDATELDQSHFVQRTQRNVSAKAFGTPGLILKAFGDESL